MVILVRLHSFVKGRTKKKGYTIFGVLNLRGRSCGFIILINLLYGDPLAGRAAAFSFMASLPNSD